MQRKVVVILPERRDDEVHALFHSGYAETASGDPHAFITNGTTMTDLGTLGGTGSEGYAINASGQATGQAGTGGTEDFSHAFLYSNGVMTDLGTAGGYSSGGVAINSSGQVTGSNLTQNTGYAEHAIVYTGGAMKDLNSLIPPEQAAKFTLIEGVAINDNGQILVSGVINSSNANRVFLLTPR